MRWLILILSTPTFLLFCISAYSLDLSTSGGVHCKMVPWKESGENFPSAKRSKKELSGDDSFTQFSVRPPLVKNYKLDCSGKADNRIPEIPVFKPSYQIQNKKVSILAE